MDHGLVEVKGSHNSTKLQAMQCRATQDRGDIVKSSDKICSTGRGGLTSPDRKESNMLPGNIRSDQSLSCVRLFATP